ncbi:MAG: exodeoxyribonuclease III [Thalassobaculales bacterium]
MGLRVATWNINSVRLRLPLLERLIAERNPDVICLQETKAPDEVFPAEALKGHGFSHQATLGMKGYNGVAILSRRPFADVGRKDWCGRQDCRHVWVKLADGTEIHDLYIPAGGDIPDPAQNEKFAHKLQFLDELAAWMEAERFHERRAIVVGDLNIAPLEHDVWSHKELLGVVSHTPVEVEKLARVKAAGRFLDSARHFVPEGEKLYSWWSYRAKDWLASNRGRRLDHIWLTPGLAGDLKAAATLRDMRGWEKASDHVAVIADLG